MLISGFVSLASSKEISIYLLLSFSFSNIFKYSNLHSKSSYSDLLKIKLGFIFLNFIIGPSIDIKETSKIIIISC